MFAEFALEDAKYIYYFVWLLFVFDNFLGLRFFFRAFLSITWVLDDTT